MCYKVEEELTSLVAEGILELVDYSDWAAPIVTMVKNVHLCGDFQMTVSLLSKLNRYLLPKVEDMFALL